MVPGIRDITTDHSPTTINPMTEAAALEGTPHTLPLATTAAHATLQLMDTPITPHAAIPTGIVTSHPTLTISPTGATCTTPQTGADLAPATPTMRHKDLSSGKSSNAQDPQPPINPTTPKTITIKDSPSDPSSDSDSDSDPLNY